jgi:nucleotide-binding universal stress UspA family protein
MTALQQPVIVAVTGTAADRAAVRLATAEAQLRERPLHVVATYVPPDPDAGPIGWAPQLVTARNAMLAALAWLRDRHPTVPVDYRVVPGDAAEVLISRSSGAEVVVVPAVPAAYDAATVAERVAAYAHCPVLVGHVPAVPGGDVVVGLDGTGPAEPLVRFGFEAAALRGARLRPMLVWSAPPDAALNTLDPFAFDRASADREADRLLAEELAGWAEKQPDVEVHRQAVYGPDVVGALTRFGADAALIVVGARSRPALSAQALGVVPRRLIRRAPCPVAVLRLGP